jgi:hypothetical protein
MDAVGNETTVAHTLKLDNLPPVISLNPPLIREWRKNGATLECSALFDPVGYDVPNDGDPVVGTGYFRVLVEDMTNQPVTNEAVVTYIAGINNDKVEIYMQRDVSIPILIDTDGDHICDEINHEALAMDLRPTKLKLAPVAPAGSPWYKIYDPMETGPVDNATCFAHTNMSPVAQPAYPNAVCLNSPMIRVVPGRVAGRPASVYAIRPMSGVNGECTGEYWELFRIADPGWICLAARSEDNKGNIGVSEPLRLCYGEDSNTVPDCSATPMPSCTDGCTISDAQKFDTDKLWYFP